MIGGGGELDGAVFHFSDIKARALSYRICDIWEGIQRRQRFDIKH